MASGRYYLDLSLKAFESGDYEAAERFAAMSMKGFRCLFPVPAKILSQIWVYVQACHINAAHAKEKTPSGGTDWYAVLGVDSSVSMDEVLHRYLDLCDMLHLGVPGVHAIERAQNLVDEAKKNITRDIKKRILEAEFREKFIELMAEYVSKDCKLMILLSFSYRPPMVLTSGLPLSFTRMEAFLRECTDCENAAPAESSGSNSEPPTSLAHGWRAVSVKRQYAEVVSHRREDGEAKRLRVVVRSRKSDRSQEPGNSFNAE